MLIKSMAVLTLCTGLIGNIYAKQLKLDYKVSLWVNIIAIASWIPCFILEAYIFTLGEIINEEATFPALFQFFKLFAKKSTNGTMKKRKRNYAKHKK